MARMESRIRLVTRRTLGPGDAIFAPAHASMVELPDAPVGTMQTVLIGPAATIEIVSGPGAALI